MRKSQTAAKKANSTRNRHNGRINAYKQGILDKGKMFTDSKGSLYSAVDCSVMIPNPTPHLIFGPDFIKLEKYQIARVA